jgi:hypothetical protein
MRILSGLTAALILMAGAGTAGVAAPADSVLTLQLPPSVTPRADLPPSAAPEPEPRMPSASEQGPLAGPLIPHPDKPGLQK